MKAHPENWVFYKLPKGEVRINSNNGEGQLSNVLTPHDAFTDNDPTTEYCVDWWPPGSAVAFHNVFEMDMGGTESFKYIKLGKTGNMGYYPMNSFLQIYLAAYNYSKNDLEYNEDNTSIDHE